VCEFESMYQPAMRAGWDEPAPREAGTDTPLKKQHRHARKAAHEQIQRCTTSGRYKRAAPGARSCEHLVPVLPGAHLVGEEPNKGQKNQEHGAAEAKDEAVHDLEADRALAVAPLAALEAEGADAVQVGPEERASSAHVRHR